MKKILIFFVLLIAVGCKGGVTEKNVVYPEFADNALNFIVASDLGRNGYYEQKPIASLMGQYAENIDVEFIVAAGDVHHFMGVASVDDPLWMTNYEQIYNHPELMIDWYAVCGNHEYRGNTQAVLDYADISRRWSAPAKYYSKVFDAGDSTQCRLVFIDTAPLIDKYRNDSIKYPDVHKQDMQRQLDWIDSVLLNSTEKWKVVVGHHPIYAQTSKDDSERTDLQARLAPILERNGVDIYYCGHIHNFQHLKPQGSKVEYMVNSSGSLSRKVQPMDDTKFCSDKAGFAFCSVTDKIFQTLFVGSDGVPIYDYCISK